MVARQTFDVGFVIPLREEFEALSAVFGDRERVSDDAQALPGAHPVGTFYRMTGPSGITVIALRCDDQGPERAAIATERLLHRFDVSLVCQIGIAGSLDSDLKLGDVVVPKIVWAYHQRGKWAEDAGGKIEYVFGSEEFKAGPRALEAVERLLDDDDGVYSAWRESAGKKRPLIPRGLGEEEDVRVRPKCHSIPKLASGPFVIASPRFWEDHLKPGTRLAEAAEMEAAGIGASLHPWGVPFLIVRGISDFADSRKSVLDVDGEWRKYAARNAATFIHTVLPGCLGARTANTPFGGPVTSGIRPTPWRPAGAGARTPSASATTDQFAELTSADLLRAYRAAQVDVSFRDVEMLLGQNPGSRVTRRAISQVVAGHAALAADIIRKTIEQKASLSDDGWQHAQRAANYASPPLTDDLAGSLGPRLGNIHIEQERHIIVALGRMGADDWAHDVLRVTLADDDTIRKLGSYAAVALARMFCYGHPGGQDTAGRTLERLLREQPGLASYAEPVLSNFRRISGAQENLLREWIEGDNVILIDLAAQAVAAAGASWAAQPLINRATNDSLSDAVRGTLLSSYGAVGAPVAPGRLLGLRNLRGPRTLAGCDEGLARCIHLADPAVAAQEIRRLLNHGSERVRMFAFRSLGMLSTPNHEREVRDGLADLPAIRGMAALAGARLGVLGEEELTDRLKQAGDDLERLMVTLALLRVTGHGDLVPEVSRLFSGMPPLDPLLRNDLKQVLRRSGGATGAELADAIEWLEDVD